MQSAAFFLPKVSPCDGEVFITFEFNRLGFEQNLIRGVGLL